MNRTRLTRPRLTRRIALASEFAITLLIAPAGFGKSVALRDYLATERVEHVRYEVRTDHDSFFEFVRGFSQALEGQVPAAIASFAGAQARAMAAENAVAELTRWMLEYLQSPLTIVIDDLHNAAPDSRSIAFLAGLIDRSYERVRWILATRSPLDLPVASWLAYERMDTPIDEQELRFTVEEALAAAQDALIGAGGAEELLRLTSGWPVAFSIGLRSSDHVAGLETLADATRDMIYRYLAEQVYRRLSDEQRRFLLETSVYPWLDYSIIEKRGDPPALLAGLRRDAGFIYTAAETEYRYHDLFREFLESELRSQGDAAYVGALRAAALTLQGLERDAEALALFVKANAVDEILRVIAASGFELMERGRTDVVQSCLNAIPEERRANNAIAVGMEAVLASRRGQLDVAEQRYVLSIERATSFAVRAELVYRYAIDLVRRGRDDAIALLEPYAADESVETTLRASILATLATAHAKMSNAPAAKRYIEQALTLLERSPSAVLRARIYQQASFVLFFSGDTQRAAQYANSAVEIAIAHGFYEIAARAYSVLYNISNDIDDDPIASLDHLERLEGCARKSGSRQIQLFALLGVYDIEVERGDDVALQRLDAQIDALEMTLPETAMQSLLPARALRAAWKKDFAKSSALLEGTAQMQGTGERRALRFAEIAVYALAANERAAADDAMAAAYAELRACDRPTARVLRSSLFLALAELLRDKEGPAHRLITDVERALQPSMRRLRALARTVRALYNRALDAETAPGLTAALERLRAEQLGGIAGLLSALPFASGENRGLNSLTTAERAILRALASGASSKLIAAETGRSPQTVDVHIRSICRKLGCRGRIEAIAVALNSGWLRGDT